MRGVRAWFSVSAAVGTLALPASTNPLPDKPDHSSPDAGLRAGSVIDGRGRVVIVLRDSAEPFDLDALRSLDRDRRRAEVVRSLRRHAGRTQAGLLAALGAAQQAGDAAEVRPLWIVNAVAASVTPALAAELAARPDVAAVLPDRQPVLAPLRPTAGAGQGRTRGVTCGLAAVRAPDAWAEGYTGEGVVVAVIDTGLCLSHPDIAGQVWTNPGEVPANGIDDDGNGFVDDLHGWDFEHDSADLSDPLGHGSHVAGTLAGDGTQGAACGMAPDAAVMPLRFANTLGGESSVWLAMQYGLDNGADVLQGALGWRHSWGPQRAVWRAVCENSFAAGVVVVFSAGSDGSDYGVDSIHTPGDVPDMITVGATDCAMNAASFSSRGPVTWQDVAPYNDWPYPPGKLKPTLVAPGINTLSHDLCDGYVSYSGVAMAVPHVAGAAAMMLQANPGLDQYETLRLLGGTAVDRGEPGPDNTYGHGFLDAWAAVRAAADAACVADFNGDGSVDALDVLAYLNAWAAGEDRADLNRDGTINALDFLAFLNRWNAGC